MNIQTICICGAGTMGRGIAQVCAAAGISTLIYEPNETVLQAAEKELKAAIDKLVQKEKVTREAGAALLQQLQFSHNIQDCRADLIIEAIIEVPEVKQQLFARLAEINTPATFIVTNTSSLSISALAQSIAYPERFAGMHFFNPAPLMQLVEVVQGPATSEQTVQVLMHLVVLLGKTPVRCTDSPGFIVNRVARPFYIEALRLAEMGVPLDQIDRVLEATGFRMGPFRLMDLIGNDVNYAVSCSVYQQLGSPGRLKPSFLQEQKVKEGNLGRKTGKGFYNYE